MLALAFNFTIGSPAPLRAQIFIPDHNIWPPPLPRPIPRPTPVPPPRHWTPLEIRSSQLNVEVTDQIAVTTTEQEFYNPNAQRLEGSFLFPLPKDAHISQFTLEIDGKPVEAELLHAKKARQIYEDIVRRVKDPALLEYGERGLYKVRVFPIEAHASRRVKLTYSQVLKADSGIVACVVPLNLQKFSAQPLGKLKLNIALKTSRPIKTLFSPSHEVAITRDGTHRATISYEANDILPDRDFQLLFSQESGELGFSLLTHRASGEDGYFLLFATPATELNPRDVLAKDVVFVMDTSGSMSGKKIEQAKKALQFCVENLNETDRFEIIRFATDIEPLFQNLAIASAAHRQQAEAFIGNLKALGGTAINDALQRALALRPADSKRPFFVIFLTDGLPTVGPTDEKTILANVRGDRNANTRVFCFGVGTDVNAHLLDKIAEETRAISQYVLPEEDLELKLSSFFSKIKEPVLAAPKLHFPQGVRASKFHPSPLPDLFKGEQLLVAGRYTGKGDGKLVLEGAINGRSKTFSFDANFPNADAQNDFIPRLWATRRVGFLLDEMRLHGESAELRDEVTELARKYGIVTPYTAYLILEDEQRRNLPTAYRTLQPIEEQAALRWEAKVVYESLAQDKSGDTGIAAARQGQALKSATAPQSSIRRSADEVARGFISPKPATPGAKNKFQLHGAFTEFNEKLEQSAQQMLFVAGKNFIQSGTQWIDVEAQKMAEAKPIRIQFNSREYFAFAAKHPSAAPWLALGQNLQFVHDGRLYEIYE